MSLLEVVSEPGTISVLTWEMTSSSVVVDPKLADSALTRSEFNKSFATSTGKDYYPPNKPMILRSSFPSAFDRVMIFFAWSLQAACIPLNAFCRPVENQTRKTKIGRRSKMMTSIAPIFAFAMTSKDDPTAEGWFERAPKS
jgi:hypothetical protein